MVHYTVIVEVPGSLAPDFETYMRRKHIPDVMATGRFVRAEFARSGEGGFRTTYIAQDNAALEDYLENESEKLRAVFAEEFPHKVNVRREVWESIEVFCVDQS